MTAPTTQQPQKLGRAVAAFAREHGALWATPSAAGGKCGEASSLFVQHLAEHGIKAFVTSGLCWEADGRNRSGHAVVRVGDEVYDWTARQFYPAAPLPLVIPFDAWTAQWQNGPT